MTWIVKALEKAVLGAAYVAGLVLVALMVLTTADVVGRYFFNAPIEGVFDLTHFAVLIMVFLGLAYCGFQDGHVTIELFFARFPKPVRGMLLRLIDAAGCIVFLVLGWRVAVQSIDVRDFNESSQLLLIPFFPFYWLAAAGAVLFALVMGVRALVPRFFPGDPP